uniref:Uncharacterized protein n=1 Tax=Ananas comosus var. bracteatus TaxID=296719 RepID=A0A6V7QRU2_ANACO
MMEILRGAAFDILQAHFIEMDPPVVSDVLPPNLEWTGFLDASVIHMNRAENFVERAQQSTVKDRSFDYIGVTPPYTAVDYGILMDQLARSPLVGENCFVVSCPFIYFFGAYTDQLLETSTGHMELFSCI